MRLKTGFIRKMVLFSGSLLMLGTALAQVRLEGSLVVREFIATANQVEYRTLPLFMSVSGAEKADFEYLGMSNLDLGPNFTVVSPSKGVAPTTVSVGLNPNVVPYLRPGTYRGGPLFGIPGQPCPGACVGGGLLLRLRPPPPPRVTAIVNAATLQPEIAPGTLVSILGTDLSTPPITAQYDAAGLYPKSLGDTSVTFNGIAAPLLYVSTTQVNAVVPFGVAGQKTVEVLLTHYEPAPPYSMPLAPTAPGIFTAGQSGRGLGAIVNEDGISRTPNSADNPAPKGSVVAIFATGAGEWVPPPPGGEQPQSLMDGSIYIPFRLPPSIPRPAAPVSVTIGGLPARLQYSGAAPYQVYGKLQVNAIIPDNIASGLQPLVLRVGDTDNAQQEVTVAVQ
jgi:uncharacterized protein (TIGR03437 family)